MALFMSETLNTMDDLLLHELKDLYDAEHRIADALPLMEEKAHHPQLKEAFQSHLRETKNQINRLEQAFQALNQKPKRETCQAAKGLIDEGEHVLKAKGDDDVLDAALIAAAQRVEHYEMAGYGSARTFAEQLGRDDVARLLQETLDEEGATDKKLTTIASSINRQAAV
jgi:ferritin-like metal-binding protein YciE